MGLIPHRTGSRPASYRITRRFVAMVRTCRNALARHTAGGKTTWSQTAFNIEAYCHVVGRTFDRRFLHRRAVRRRGKTGRQILLTS